MDCKLKERANIVVDSLAAEGRLYLLSHLSVSFWDQMISPKAVAGFPVQCLSCCHRLCCLLFCGHLSTFFMELKYKIYQGYLQFVVFWWLKHSKCSFSIENFLDIVKMHLTKLWSVHPDKYYEIKYCEIFNIS